MENIIGEDAGKIWEYLNEQEDGVTLTALGKAVDLKAAELNRALGWLAREGKLAFDTSKKTPKVGLVR